MCERRHQVEKTCLICGLKPEHIFSFDLDLPEFGACPKHLKEVERAIELLLYSDEAEFEAFLKDCQEK